MVGPGADSVAASLASACHEAGMTTLVLDLEGRVAARLKGRFRAVPPGRFVYDSQRMEERASFHAELAASAYTLSLNLNFEQEGFLNSAIQYIALEGGVASPASLADRLSAEGEFRGKTADELRGKLVALRALNVTGEAGVVRGMLGGGVVADLSRAESRQAAEVAAMVLLAKALAVAESGGRLPEVLMVTGANRLFVDSPVARHGNRLLMALLSADTSRVLVSETAYGLDRDFFEASPVRILSSTAHNGGWEPRRPWRRERADALVLTPNMFTLQDLSRGYEDVFVPRDFPLLEGGDEVPAAEETRPPDDALAKKVLEAFARYDSATRGSIVGFLSAEEPPEELEKVVDRLQGDGFLVVVGKDAGRDSPLQTYRLTQKGYGLLRELS